MSVTEERRKKFENLIIKFAEIMPNKEILGKSVTIKRNYFREFRIFYSNYGQFVDFDLLQFSDPFNLPKPKEVFRISLSRNSLKEKNYETKLNSPKDVHCLLNNLREENQKKIISYLEQAVIEST